MTELSELDIENIPAEDMKLLKEIAHEACQMSYYNK